MVVEGPGAAPNPRCPMLPLLLVPLLASAQNVNIQPLIELLRPESMNRMAAIATELSSLAASNIRTNEKQIKESNMDAELPLEQDARPSRLLGAAAAEMSSQGRNAFIQALAPLAGIPPPPPPPPPAALGSPQPIIPEQPEATTIPTIAPRPNVGGLNIQRLDKAVPAPEELGINAPVEPPPSIPAPVEPPSGISTVRASPRNPLGVSTGDIAPVQPSPINPLGAPSQAVEPVVKAEQAPNALLRIANAFLGGQNQGGSADGTTNVAKEVMSLGLKDFIPSADSNFGIPKGRNCLPFLSEFMQVAYGNCQQVADERAFDAWGTELRNAILTGQIDILKASQETCRRGAERQQCATLRRAIADCDIMKSLTVGAQLQRAMKRCEDVGGLVDQNPMIVLGQLNNLIGGEVAQGFFNNFLGGKQSQ